MHSFCRADDAAIVLTVPRLEHEAQRSIKLLEAIESTVSHLASDTDILHAVCRDAANVVKGLEAWELGAPIDPEGKVASTLGQCLDSLARMYRTCTSKRDVARRARELKAEDGVAEAYDCLLEALVAAHETLEELRERVETLSAMASPVMPGSYENVDDLVAAIFSRR